MATSKPAVLGLAPLLITLFLLALVACGGENRYDLDRASLSRSPDEWRGFAAREVCPENADEFELRLGILSDSEGSHFIIRGYHFDDRGKDDTKLFWGVDWWDGEPFVRARPDNPAEVFLAERPESCEPGSTAPVITESPGSN